VVLERIRKWRAAQLTPWKAKTAADTAAAGSSKDSSNSSKDHTKSSSSRVEGPVARVYSVYSSMQIGSSCLGLHMDGFLQLLRDSHIIGER
jgi:hypothetical protein